MKRIKFFQIILACFFLCLFVENYAQAPFITTWDTQMPGVSPSDQIRIPGTGTDYLIEWEEVGNPSNSGSRMATDEVRITFPHPGIYQISISGDFTRIRFNAGPDRLKLASIDQWGDIEWECMEEAFKGCELMEYRATDVPDLTRVESMSKMFRLCRNFNGYIDDWDVSNVRDFSSMFLQANSYNQPLNSWDVSNAENMDRMFAGPSSFNQPLNSWDVSKVKNMEGMFSWAIFFNQPLDSWDVSGVENMMWMFSDAQAFNQPLASWDVSNVTTMRLMFVSAISFNQPLNSWDVSKVKNMEGMFLNAGVFNQPLDGWDVSNVTDMSDMFRSAQSFNQDLGSWDLHTEVDMRRMFDDSGMSCKSYDSTIIGWYNNTETPDNRKLGAEGVEYWLSSYARGRLISEKGWMVEGDEYGDCNYLDCDLPIPFIDIKGDSEICDGDTLRLEAAHVVDRYLWYRDGKLLVEQSQGILMVTKPGLYQLQYMEEEFCISERSEWVEVVFLDVGLSMTNARDTVLRSAIPNCEGKAVFDAALLGCDLDLAATEAHSLWRLDIHNTGSFDRISTEARPDGSQRENLRIEEELPFGTHRVQWEIRDNRGNEVTEEHLITLVDMNPPTPVCIHGIAASIHPSSGQITLPAWVYDVGSWDDCTDSEDLIFTFSSDLSHTHHTWTCDDLDGEIEQTLEIEIWVTNQYGHQNHCVTYIKVQDNQEACPDTAGVTIVVSGQVITPGAIPVEEVVMVVENDFQTYYLSGKTDGDGQFTLNVPVEEELLLSGQYTDDPLNGLSTYDIVLIHRHILGISPLGGPYERIAADVNDDGRIDMLDIAQLRKLILGSYYQLPNNSSWKVIADDPPEMDREVPEHRLVVELDKAVRDVGGKDFVAIKIGDVNASHQPGGVPAEERSLREKQYLEVADIYFEKGDQVEVVFSMQQPTELIGYQGTVAFDPGTLEFVDYSSGRLPLTDAHFGFHGLEEGQITTSWSTPAPQSIEKGEGLWAFHFEARSEGRLSDLLQFSSVRTPAEAYTVRGTEELKLTFGGEEKEVFTLHPNRPNPFKSQTTIGITLATPELVTLSVFNAVGQEVKSLQRDEEAGYHEFPIRASDLGPPGLYFYRVESGGSLATGKMVLK